MAHVDHTRDLTTRFATTRFATHPGGQTHLQHMLDEQLATGGKRLRARLPVDLVTGATGRADGPLVRAATVWGAAIELVHNGTLVHDDIQDGDELRRDRPTLWVTHGMAQAINAGDALLVGPLLLVLEAEELPARARPRLAALLADAALETIRGQVADIGWRAVDDGARFDPRAAERDLERVFRSKTAPLFACALMGALVLLGEEDDDALQPARELADGLGIAFQVRDDLLDLVGTKGRGEAGADLREGKRTWPVLAAMAEAPAEESAALRRRLGAVDSGDDLGAEELAHWLRWIADHGGVEAATRRLTEALDRCRALARATFPPGAASVVLALCDRLAKLDG